MNEWVRACPNSRQSSHCQHQGLGVTMELHLLQSVSSCVMMSHFPPTCPESLPRQPLLRVRQWRRCFPQPWTKCTFMIWEEMEMMGQPFQVAHLCPSKSSRQSPFYPPSCHQHPYHLTHHAVYMFVSFITEQYTFRSTLVHLYILQCPPHFLV